MRRIAILSTVLALCSVMITGSLPVRAQAIEIDALDAFIEQALRDSHVPGASVAIVQDGEVLYLKGHGVRKTGTQESVDEHTLFQLASVTKTFTAAAVASMVDRDKIQFDEPVVRIIPGFALKESYPTLHTTARDLLAHRSGLPAFTGDLFDHLGYTREEVIRRVRYIDLASSFRERAHYSNVGYFLAGEVAAYAAGATWEAVIEANLLEPLSMTRTGFTKTLDEQSNVAAPHAIVGGKIETIANSRQLVLAPAGAMTSTASDLSKYMIMLLNDGRYQGTTVLKKDSIEQLFTPAMVDQPSFAELPPISEQTGFAYGLAWGLYYWHDHKILEKGGALDGMRSVVVLVPQIKLGIAVLANRNLTVFPEAVRAYVLERVLGRADEDLQAKIRQRSKAIESRLRLAHRAHRQNPNPTSKDLSAYAGTYESDLYGTFTVVQTGAHLAVEAGPARYPGELKHINGDTFALQWPVFISIPDEVSFVIDAHGKVVAFIDDTLGRFERVD